MTRVISAIFLWKPTMALRSFAGKVVLLSATALNSTGPAKGLVSPSEVSAILTLYLPGMASTPLPLSPIGSNLSVSTILVDWYLRSQLMRLIPFDRLLRMMRTGEPSASVPVKVRNGSISSFSTRRSASEGCGIRSPFLNNSVSFSFRSSFLVLGTSLI